MNPWLLSLACLGLLFPVTSEAEVQNGISEAMSASELPFKLTSGYLIQVEGRIGTQTNLKFILDTGATVSIVDPKIADKFKLDQRPAHQCPVLEVQVQGHPIRLLVDTGLSGIVLYEERLRKQVLGLRTAGHVVDVTMGGRVHAKQATLPDVLLGKTNRDIPVLLVPSPATDMLPGIEGIIGVTLLQAHRVYFDFPNRSLRWD